MVRRLGIIRNGYSQPLFHALRRREASQQDPQFAFELIADTPANLAVKLRQGDLDAAFLSPVDYAKEPGRYRIVPEIGLISAGESRAVRLQFKERLNKIQSIAVRPDVSSSDIVLATLVLAEKYELTPSIVPVADPAQSPLQKADALLVTGDEAFIAGDIHQLDLVDEWNDICELPYVHGFWAAAENSLTVPEIRKLVELSQAGIAEYEYSGEEQLWFEEHFGYHLHEDAVVALGEFLNMAYYHGILKELVVPRFFDLKKIKSA